MHDAIAKAIADTRASRKELIPYLSTHLAQTFRENARVEIDVLQLETRIEALKAQTMELITQSISSHCVAENELRLRGLSDEIKTLTILTHNTISPQQNCFTTNTLFHHHTISPQ